MGEPKRVACRRCGESTTYTGTALCSNCWEVEIRLEKYLKSEKARAVTKTILYRFEQDESPRFSMSAKSGVVGKITKLKVDWDKFSVVQERNDHNMHIVAKRLLPGQPNANGDIFPKDFVYSVGAPVYAPGNNEPVGVIAEVNEDDVHVVLKSFSKHEDKKKGGF